MIRFKFIQNWIDALRGKKKKRYVVKGKNNIIDVVNKNSRHDLNIIVRGDNNKVIIKTTRPFFATIYVGNPHFPSNNCTVLIDEDASCENCMIKLMEHGCNFTIGKDCMLSANVEFWATDGHMIYNDNNEVINIGKSIEVGDHCWIGYNTRILKNTKIPSGSVVGMGSIVTRKFDKERVAIAGNPAKIVKEDINWARVAPGDIVPVKEK